MIKVVHIAQSAGGVERYLEILLKNLNKEKFKNILIVSQDYNTSKFKDICSEIFIIKMCRELRVHQDLNALFQIRKIIKHIEPNIVYSHSSKAGVLGRLADIGINNVNIYNAHGWSFNMRCSAYKKFIYKNIERLMAKFCDHIIAISKYEKESAINMKICKRDKISMIYNGVEELSHKKNTISRKILEIPKDSYVIGFVGRFSEQKAPDIFIKAAYLIKKKIPNSYFLMIGCGDEKNSILDFISTHHMSDYIKIIEWVDNPCDYMMVMDLGMLLSRWEGFGLVIIEYMLAKVPVIATNVDAIPDIIIHEWNGIIVPVDLSEKVADQAYRLYKNPKFADYLISNAYGYVRKRFMASRFVKEHEELFESLISLKLNGGENDKN